MTLCEGIKLEEHLKEHFGYNDFRLHQKEIINAVLGKQDVIAILPTGAGKSLCYQLPAMLMEGTAIVVSPLISLMQDQVTSLFKNGVPAAFINSSLYSQDIRHVLDNLSDYKLLYVAPERLLDEQFLEKIKAIPLSFFVIDEAHCISQWGHSFRVEYGRLHLLKELFPQCAIIALTATATEDVQKDMIKQLAMPNPVIIKGSFDRPNLTIRIQSKNDLDKQLFDFLALQNNQPGIIYSSTRKGVDAIFQKLQQFGWNARRYHGGLTDKERSESQHSFLHDEVTLMVATMAFGMGVHKPDIRFIVHLDMPRSIEQYYQEIGRAGRDGLPAECLMFYGPADYFIYKFFDDKIEDPAVRDHMFFKTNRMQSLCRSQNCRKKELLKYFGETYSKVSCESCDNCLDDFEKFDGTLIAQKIISCVYRLQQRFGIRTVVDVLRGSKNQTLINKGHQHLSTYGLLQELSEQEVRYYINALIEMETLTVSEGEYPILQCTEKSKEVIKDHMKVNFKKLIFATPKEKKQRLEKTQTILNYNIELYEDLKKLRLSCAREEKVPPYVVFSDRALQEMAVYFPNSEQEFIKINGVGPVKWLKYGEKFLKLISGYHIKPVVREQVESSVKRVNSVEETIRLFQNEPDVEKIMKVRELTRGTIITHLTEGLEKGVALDITPLVSKERSQMIQVAIAQVGVERLAPIKAILPEDFTYDEIRLVVAQQF